MRYTITAHIAQEMPHTPDWVVKRPLLRASWCSVSGAIVIVAYCGALLAPIPCTGLVFQVGFAMSTLTHSASFYWAWAVVCFEALALVGVYGGVAFLRNLRVNCINIDAVVISVGSILAGVALAFDIASSAHL